MKKTPTAPANQSGANEPEKPKSNLRSVYLTKTRWEALRATGNANHAINAILDKAGIAE